MCSTALSQGIQYCSQESLATDDTTEKNGLETTVKPVLLLTTQLKRTVWKQNGKTFVGRCFGTISINIPMRNECQDEQQISTVRSEWTHMLLDKGGWTNRDVASVREEKVNGDRFVS